MEQLESEIVDSEIVLESDEAIATPAVAALEIAPAAIERRRALLYYLVLPLTLLLVTLLGGIRFSSGSVVYIKPALIYLIFAAGLMILFFVANLVRFDGWISERFDITKNLINAITLFALFAASVQVFNSVIPESGIPFWIVSFCFLWTLWNNLFSNFDTKRLLRSLAAMFSLAFVVKYVVLANLAQPADQGWLDSIINNPAQTAATWLLDIPQFSAATGYLQFFTIAIFVIALWFFPNSTEE
jgi:hypothetical protein